MFSLNQGSRFDGSLCGEYHPVKSSIRNLLGMSSLLRVVKGPGAGASAASCSPGQAQPRVSGEGGPKVGSGKRGALNRILSGLLPPIPVKAAHFQGLAQGNQDFTRAGHAPALEQSGAGFCAPGARTSSWSWAGESASNRSPRPPLPASLMPLLLQGAHCVRRYFSRAQATPKRRLAASRDSE